MMISNNGPLWTSMKWTFVLGVILILVIYLRDRLRRKDTLIVFYVGTNIYDLPMYARKNSEASC